MEQSRSNKRSSDLAIDVLVDYTRKLYSEEKVKKLEKTADDIEKIR